MMVCPCPHMTIESRGIKPGESWAFTDHPTMKEIMEQEMSVTIKIHLKFTEKMRLAFLQPHKDFDLKVGITNMLWMAERYNPEDNDNPPAIIPADPTDDMIEAFAYHLCKISNDIQGAFFALVDASPFKSCEYLVMGDPKAKPCTMTAIQGESFCPTHQMEVSSLIKPVNEKRHGKRGPYKKKGGHVHGN